MKKVILILPILSFLCLSGCDFLRKVAGRPTEADIEAKAGYIEKRRQEIQDSILTSQAAHSLDSIGVKLSDVFRFGQPQEQLRYRYNLIIGVFRNRSVVDAKFDYVSSRSFSPFLIPFEGGVNALCLCASDNLADIIGPLQAGREAGICPRDAWIYVNGK